MVWKWLARSDSAVRSVASGAAFGLLVAGLLYVVGPMLEDFSTYGFHDWDVETAYRYITVLALKHGEGPWWHPWLCGGVPAWGYVEGASNFVSPYLPLYWLADVRTAIRLELLGQGLLALAGTWAFAGTFTRSAALRALVAALFVLNGRWALQAAVGHTWHLQYALMPWAFYFFERSLQPSALRNAAWAGAAMALACYWGGIYPLPHTALFLSGYALLRAALERNTRPLAALAIAGFSALGLAAPKLFAVLDHMQKVPRLIESTEVIGPLDLLAMLAAPNQRYGVHTVPVPAYNWHEWGIYVGPLGVLAIVAGLFLGVGDGVRGRAFAVLGAFALLLGFGAFHPLAPWALLHHLPLFSSQHVPSRFHYPMLLLLGAALLAFAGQRLDPRIQRRPWLDLVFLLPVALLVWDMVRFSRTPFEQAFWMRAPESILRVEPFEHRARPPVNYLQRDWAPPMLLAMFANTGVTRCYGVDPAFKPSAIAKGSPGYRGRAYVDGVPGATAEVVEWTPNRAVVSVRSAPAGSLVVYNMNYDPSFRADGERALEHEGLVAARLRPGAKSIEFRYFPRTLPFALVLCSVTLALCLAPGRVYAGIRERVSRAARSSRSARPPDRNENAAASTRAE